MMYLNCSAAAWRRYALCGIGVGALVIQIKRIIIRHAIVAPRKIGVGGWAHLHRMLRLRVATVQSCVAFIAVSRPMVIWRFGCMSGP
jgi:hypothetical protein